MSKLGMDQFAEMLAIRSLFESEINTKVSVSRSMQSNCVYELIFPEQEFLNFDSCLWGSVFRALYDEFRLIYVAHYASMPHSKNFTIFLSRVKK